MNDASLLPALLAGTATTAAIFAGAAAVALPAAALAGAARSAPLAWVRWLAVAYVELFRGTAALVQLYWAYFVLPAVGIRLEAMTVAIVVLGLNAGAYGAEIVRAALAAVPAGQREAAQALGLSRGQALLTVVAPQALAVALPPAGNLLVELLKNTALASLVGLAELCFQARVLQASTLRTAFILLLLLGIYFVLAQIVEQAMTIWERRATRWRAPVAAA